MASDGSNSLKRPCGVISMDEYNNLLAMHTQLQGDSKRQSERNLLLSNTLTEQLLLSNEATARLRAEFHNFKEQIAFQDGTVHGIRLCNDNLLGQNRELSAMLKKAEKIEVLNKELSAENRKLSVALKEARRNNESLVVRERAHLAALGQVVAESNAKWHGGSGVTDHVDNVSDQLLTFDTEPSQSQSSSSTTQSKYDENLRIFNAQYAEFKRLQKDVIEIEAREKRLHVPKISRDERNKILHSSLGLANPARVIKSIIPDQAAETSTESTCLGSSSPSKAGSAEIEALTKLKGIPTDRVGLKASIHASGVQGERLTSANRELSKAARIGEAGPSDILESKTYKGRQDQPSHQTKTTANFTKQGIISVGFDHDLSQLLGKARPRPTVGQSDRRKVTDQNIIEDHKKENLHLTTRLDKANTVPTNPPVVGNDLVITTKAPSSVVTSTPFFLSLIKGQSNVARMHKAPRPVEELEQTKKANIETAKAPISGDIESTMNTPGEIIAGDALIETSSKKPTGDINASSKPLKDTENVALLGQIEKGDAATKEISEVTKQIITGMCGLGLSGGNDDQSTVSEISDVLCWKVPAGYTGFDQYQLRSQVRYAENTLFYEEGIRFQPGPACRNAYRSTMMTGIPNAIDLRDITAVIRGGELQLIQAVGLPTIMSKCAQHGSEWHARWTVARIVFLHEKSAIAFEDYANKTGIYLDGSRVNVSVVTTPTWPMNAELEKLVFEDGASRVINLAKVYEGEKLAEALTGRSGLVDIIVPNPEESGEFEIECDGIVSAARLREHLIRKGFNDVTYGIDPCETLI